MAKLEKERFRSARTIKKFRHAEQEKTYAPSTVDVEFLLKRWRKNKPKAKEQFAPWMIELAERIQNNEQ